MTAPGFWSTLRQRKLVQWTLAYVAAAWVVLQALALLADVYGWPPVAMRVVAAVLAVGLPVAVVLAWYHGERGAQRASGAELTIIAALLAIGGLLLWGVERGKPGSEYSFDAEDEAGRAVEPKLYSDPGFPTSDRSVAVLPFADLSAAGDQEYFGDGIAEELLNVLTRVDGLSVASRTSSFAFKGKAVAVPEIAAALKVGHIVEGSVRKSGDRLRITAQLIDVATDRHLWSETYERQLTDVFAIQDEIAHAIADALRVSLNVDAGDRAGTRDEKAYDRYLSGLYQFNQRTEASLRQALAIFEEATALDPGFARAWAGLSMTYYVLPFYADFDRDLAFTRAEAAARRAVLLDPDSAEAHTALAGVLSDHGGGSAEAMAAFDRAIALDPKYATARHWKAIELSRAGDLAGGEAELRRALALDPDNLPLRSFLSVNLSLQGRCEESLAENQALLQRAPDYRNGLHQLFLCAAMLGRAREFLPSLRRWFEVVGQDPAVAEKIVAGIEDPARRAAAVAALNAIEPRLQGGGLRGQVQTLYALLHAGDDVMRIMESQQDAQGTMYARSPLYEFLRGDPRFEAEVARRRERAR